MLEHFSEPLPPRWKFLLRLARNFVGGVAIIVGSLMMGMIGFRYFDSLSWVDAYLNASMLLSGMGPVGTPKTDAGKVFAGTFALYSGFVVILASGIVFAPVVHRLLHRFHVSSHHKKEDQRNILHSAGDHSMSKSGNAPRKPATKFPHLRKQMAKNTLLNKQPPKTSPPPRGRKGSGGR